MKLQLYLARTSIIYKVQEKLINNYVNLSKTSKLCEHKHNTTGPILAVYCVQLSHAITCPFSKYFQILYIIAQIFKYFALFLKSPNHALTF